MQRAKAFAYVSLGILALALAFHLGATTARSQTGSQVVIGEIDQTGDPSAVALDQNGYIWRWSRGALPSPPVLPPKPGPIAAVGPGSGGQWILYENGDIYLGDSFEGNIFATGPVPTRTETWGHIKADRR